VACRPIGSDPQSEVHECKLKALALAAAGWGDRGQDDLVGQPGDALSPLVVS